MLTFATRRLVYFEIEIGNIETKFTSDFVFKSLRFGKIFTPMGINPCVMSVCANTSNLSVFIDENAESLV